MPGLKLSDLREGHRRGFRDAADPLRNDLARVRSIKSLKPCASSCLTNAIITAPSFPWPCLRIIIKGWCWRHCGDNRDCSWRYRGDIDQQRARSGSTGAAVFVRRDAARPRSMAARGWLRHRHGPEVGLPRSRCPLRRRGSGVADQRPAACRDRLGYLRRSCCCQETASMKPHKPYASLLTSTGSTRRSPAALPTTGCSRRHRLVR